MVAYCKEETLFADLYNGILTITLNRPEKLNAYTQTMLQDMIAVFDRADADNAVRIIVVTGAGRAFCAGADLSESAGTFDYRLGGQHTSDQSPTTADGTVDFSNPAAQDGGGQLAMRIFHLNKPIIAAINGPAFGVGATMTLAMDIRVMSSAASFGFPFARLGVVPEAASSWFLPRIVGISKALEWCIGAKTINSSDAERAGLVRDVCKPETLLHDVQELAASLIVDTAPVSVALARRMLWTMLGADHPIEASRLDSQAMWSRGASADAAEGIGAHFDKRQPEFPNTVSDDMPQLPPWLDQKDYS